MCYVLSRKYVLNAKIMKTNQKKYIYIAFLKMFPCQVTGIRPIYMTQIKGFHLHRIQYIYTIDQHKKDKAHSNRIGHICVM